MLKSFEERHTLDAVLLSAQLRSLERVSDWALVNELYKSRDEAFTESLLWLLGDIDPLERDAFFRSVRESAKAVLPPLYPNAPFQAAIYAQEVTGTGGFLVTLSCGHKKATRHKRVRYQCLECESPTRRESNG